MGADFAGNALILHNQGGNGNHWRLVNLLESAGNRDGIGAKIRLVSDSGQEQCAFVSTAGSYLSASDKRAHFGLGSSKRARLIEVTWPSGTVQRLGSVSVLADQILTIREPPK